MIDIQKVAWNNTSHSPSRINLFQSSVRLLHISSTFFVHCQYHLFYTHSLQYDQHISFLHLTLWCLVYLPSGHRSIPFKLSKPFFYLFSFLTRITQNRYYDLHNNIQTIKRKTTEVNYLKEISDLMEENRRSRKKWRKETNLHQQPKRKI